MDLINKKSLQELIKATFMEMKPRLEEERLILTNLEKNTAVGNQQAGLEHLSLTHSQKPTTKMADGVCSHIEQQEQERPSF